MTASLTVDVIEEAAAWRDCVPGAKTVARTAAVAAWRATRAACGAAETEGPAEEVSILLTDDDTVRRLNREHRAKDRPTNVLSFPVGPAAAGGGAPVMLGDVVLAAGVVTREAREQDKAPADHLRHLVIHGVLHLLGYDHGSEEEARIMERLETTVLAAFGVADPYRYGAAAE